MKLFLEYKEKLFKGYKFAPISKNKPTVKKRAEIQAQIKQNILTSKPYPNELSLKEFIDQWQKEPQKGYEPTLKEICNKIKLSKKEKEIAKAKEKAPFFDNPIKLESFLEKYLSEPEPNFHY